MHIFSEIQFRFLAAILYLFLPKLVSDIFSVFDYTFFQKQWLKYILFPKFNLNY